MARRRNSPADDVLDLTSRLPWWACLAAAAVASVVLHGWATAPAPTSLRPNDASGAMFGAVFRALAFVVVQVKHWRARLVPVEVVRALAGVMPFRRAARAFVVTSGRFTDAAAEFARGRGIGRVDGSRLQGLPAQARASLDAQPGGRRDAPSHRVAVPVSPAASAPPSAPACPACAAPLQLRSAGRGANAGRRFRGCSTDPACKGTRPA